MKFLSLMQASSKVVKTKGHEYSNTNKSSQNDEGSPTGHEHGLCEEGNKKSP